MPASLSRKSTVSILGWVLLGLAILVSIGMDVRNMAQGGSVDLRNHITGVRLMERGIDPYRYHWHEGDPPEYIDLRNNPHLPVSKTTVTPALLLLHLPFAGLPYRVTQYLWLGGQWLLLLGTGWLWWRACTTSLQGRLVALFVTGFSYTAAWRWQAERGQAYVLLAFLLACWLTTTLNVKRGNGFAAGFVAGILVALRPPVLLLLPFLVLHRRGQLAGAATGLLLGFGLPPLFSLTIWTDYFSAMQDFSHLYRFGINPAAGHQNFPPVIEGVSTNLLGHLMPFSAGDFSVHALVKWLGFGPIPDWPPLVLVTALLALWFWFTRRKPAVSLLPGLAAWFFLTDLFLPALRWSYHDVFILNVVLAEIVTSKKIPWALWPCALALPLGWGVYAFWPAAPWVINLPAFFFTLGAILALFPYTFQRNGPTTKSPMRVLGMFGSSNHFL